MKRIYFDYGFGFYLFGILMMKMTGIWIVFLYID